MTLRSAAIGQGQPPGNYRGLHGPGPRAAWDGCWTGIWKAPSSPPGPSAPDPCQQSKAPLKALTPPRFSKYRDRRAGTSVSATRELQFIRSVFSSAIEYGHMDSKPAKAVRLFPGQRRDRYI